MKTELCIGTKHNGYTIYAEKQQLVIHQVMSLYDNLIDKKEKDIVINLKDVDFIEVSYSTYDSGLWGMNCMLVLKTHLKNGNIVDFHGKIEANRNDFVAGYELLRSMDVQFKDTFGILEYILNSNINRIDYILTEMINNHKLKAL